MDVVISSINSDVEGEAGRSVLEGESKMSIAQSWAQSTYLSSMNTCKVHPHVMRGAMAHSDAICLNFNDSPVHGAGDSIELTVTVQTDPWGYEMYWELFRDGGVCGDGDALAWGGNPEVGCGDGIVGLDSEVLGNNVVVESDPVCVVPEDNLVLVHRDSYGDGGTQFMVTLAGMDVYAFGGTGYGNDWGFQPLFLDGDLPCLADTIVTNGPHWMGSTSAATVSPGEPAPPGLGCGTYGGWCESGLSHTAWVAWEVPDTGGVYSITTCNPGTTFDTQLALWSVGDCSDFETYELLNANDDIGCSFGAYRSGLLTPCLDGGETLMIQIDGYYGEAGEVELSVESSNVESWSIGSSVQDLSCSLESSFNPNGSISVNTNVGPESVNWAWSGPFGFSSSDASIGPLLPGAYELTAGYCGATTVLAFEVEEPEPMSVMVSLDPDCENASMSGAAEVVGGQGELDVTWTVGSFQANGVNADSLPGGLCTVEVVDENGCEASQWAWIESVGVPEVNLGPDQFGCAGDAFTLLAPIGSNLNYVWTTGHTGALAVIETVNPGTLVIGVEVSDAAGCSDTDAIILTLDDCSTGVGQLDASLTVSNWSAAPNPFESSIRIETTTFVQPGSVYLMSVSGQKVPCEWQQEGTTLVADVNVAPGVYFVKCDEIPGALRLVRQ